MDIKISGEESLQKTFQVIVPSSDIATKKMGFIKSRAHKVKIDGFRPGKAPMPILEQRLGEDALNHVLRTSIDTAVKSCVKDHDLRYIGEPKVDFGDFSEGKDLSFSVQFELLPNVEVKDYSGLSLEKIVVDVQDKDVTEALNRLHKDHKSFEENESDKPAKKGDRVAIECTLSENGAPLANYPAFEANVELGEEFMLSDLDKVLIGAKVGDVKETETTVSKKLQDANLAGKAFHVSIKVKKINAPIVHKIDDTFAKEFGQESLETLKKTLKENLARNYESIARLYMKRHLLDALEGMYSFELPKSMVNNEFNTIWNHLQAEINTAKQSGEYDESETKPEEELKSDYEKIAARRVKLGLVISEVARAEKIQLSQDELRNALYREAMKYQGQERQVMEYFRNHPENIERIAAPILEDKVVDHIATKVKMNEVKVDVTGLKKKVKGVVPTMFDHEEDAA